MEFRAAIERFLQRELKDPGGTLLVDELGPKWIGASTIELSYSHSGAFAILVWSNTHKIGVDLETLTREYSHPLLELASRFFHENEVRILEKFRGNPSTLSFRFLDLWLKKEAYAKLTRNGLKEAIHLEVDSISDVVFEVVPVTPAGCDARVALR
jgi:hypothetical protein